ncbi:osteocalcin-like isoform X2 [Podarcis raffonei]|uniref:osteocalcin-like isoform X2 n=1 Tax=Podarcis raffonei TaxID=65483 RepID=UPI00232941E6|nr:osteocalcin-like isoform X2 [Podarcis raffonei]
MGNLQVLLFVTLVLTALFCCDGGVKISRETANAFVRRQKRSSLYYERYYERFKTPMEMKQEQCESHPLCDYYSEVVGFQTAYRYFFGN